MLLPQSLLPWSSPFLLQVHKVVCKIPPPSAAWLCLDRRFNRQCHRPGFGWWPSIPSKARSSFWLFFFRASKLGWNTPHDDDILVSDSQARGAMCAGGGNAGTEAGVASVSPVMWRRLLPLLLLPLLPLLQLAIVCCCLQAEQLAATAASALLHQRIPRPGRCSPRQQHHPLPCPAWHCQARDSCPL